MNPNVHKRNPRIVTCKLFILTMVRTHVDRVKPSSEAPLTTGGVRGRCNTRNNTGYSHDTGQSYSHASHEVVVVFTVQ